MTLFSIELAKASIAAFLGPCTVLTEIISVGTSVVTCNPYTKEKSSSTVLVSDCPVLLN